jgi:hypothetical protein
MIKVDWLAVVVLLFFIGPQSDVKEFFFFFLRIEDSSTPTNGKQGHDVHPNKKQKH